MGSLLFFNHITFGFSASNFPSQSGPTRCSFAQGNGSTGIRSQLVHRNRIHIKQVDFNEQTRSYQTIVSIDSRLKSEKLVKVVNLFGQEVSESEKEVLIYVYDDGLTKKRIN